MGLPDTVDQALIALAVVAHQSNEPAVENLVFLTFRLRKLPPPIQQRFVNISTDSVRLLECLTPSSPRI